MMRPARGPVSVLCVVVVTTSQYGHRVGVHAGGDEAGDVGDVGHQQGAALVGDLAEGGEVDGARVGAVAADDELGPVLQRQRAHLVVVDGLGVGAHVVGDHVVRCARSS